MTVRTHSFWNAAERDAFVPFFEHAPVIMHVTDASGCVESVNGFWLESLGYEHDEVIGRPAIDFLTDQSRRLMDGGVRAAFRRRGGASNVELDILRKDGSVMHALVSTTPQHDSRGVLMRYLVITLDNTVAREAGEALRAKAREADTANRAKSSFLANMSHEIRTPLNGVLGMASALEQTPLNAQQSRMLAVLSRSGHQLLSLLDDLLDLSKIEAGQISLETEPFEPDALISDVVELFRPRLAGRPLDMLQGTRLGAETQVIGNPKRIRQVLTNLVSNALKFTQEGQISVSADLTVSESGETMLNVRVSDTGAGVPDNLKEAIFGRFHRGVHETDDAFGGAGLGLTIARTICDLHGGALEVRDTPGGGATFIARFHVEPCPVVTHAEPAPSSTSDLYSLDRPVRVLVAEDNETNRMVLEAMLFGAPVEMTFAENGEIALDLWNRMPFDGAIVDIRMPVMGGLEFMRRIRNDEARRDAPARPLAACSANVMTEQINSYLTAGFDRFVPKPVMMDDLVECLLWIARGGTAATAKKRRAG